MKLGISYIAFQGHELLEFVLPGIRPLIDFISVVYQETSHFGQRAHADLLPTLQKLRSDGLVDQIVLYDPNILYSPKQNEQGARNVGRLLSEAAGCTHHISADVDEFYVPEQLAFAKETMGDHDCSLVGLNNYYKDPTFLIEPCQGHRTSFIQKVDVHYDAASKFPYQIDLSRRPSRWDRCRVFDRDEFVVHHMSFVRRDIRTKLANTNNGKLYQIDKFVSDFDKYNIGDRLCVAPDFCIRRTVLRPDIFGIKEASWVHRQ